MAASNPLLPSQQQNQSAVCYLTATPIKQQQIATTNAPIRAIQAGGMNTPGRRSIAIRTTSPPLTPHTPRNNKFPSLGDFGMLSPPPSPPRKLDSSSDLKIDFDSLDPQKSSFDAIRRFTYTNDGIIICPYEIDFIKDHSNHKHILGYGAWSTVFKGTCRFRTTPQNGLLTPPVHGILLPPLLVAVKCPSRKDAISIIRSEAKTLSHLRELDPNEDRVAAFHGIAEEYSSLILSAHPLSLEDHIKTCARQAASPMATMSLSSPILGNTAIWLDLADRLIDTLDWMHNEAAIVHGDIKPSNILLRPNTDITNSDAGFAYQPLFIDFSSSQRLDSDIITPNTLSAVTKEYTAPELLTVAVLKDPNACATSASDIFSLGVTLLVAATGDTMVYPCCNTFQRQYFATQGTSILGNVRNLSLRVPRHGIVSKVLEKAFMKKDFGRVTTKAWKEFVSDVRRDLEGQSKRKDVRTVSN